MLNKWLFRFVMIISCLYAIALIIFLLGIRINVSRSIPIGIYVLTQEDIHKNDIVYFEIPKEKRFSLIQKIAKPYNHLFKKIVAMENDTIEIKDGFVYLNSKKIPYSKIKPGMLPYFKNAPNIDTPIKYTLKENELFLLGNTLDSIDSRYFGIVSRTQIKFYKARLLIGL